MLWRVILFVPAGVSKICCKGHISPDLRIPRTIAIFQLNFMAAGVYSMEYHSKLKVFTYSNVQILLEIVHEPKPLYVLYLSRN
jgi:hypothetical protein